MYDMFGYIRPLECELKVREQKEYRAHYCGLCRAIGNRYGVFARALLSYDCAFLSAFLTAMEGAPVCCGKRCGYRPFRGKNPVACPSAALDYAADVNVLLGWHSLRDHWKDEKRLSALLLTPLVHPAYRKARVRHAELDEQIEGALARLGELERQNAACTDEPSDAFGTLMRQIILHAPMLREEDRAACGWMFYNLGRWVYLADAWDDRARDRKKGNYNPFLTTDMDGESASFLLYVSLTEAEKGYDLVSLSGAHGLTDNIMHLGCRAVTQRMLGKENTE